MEVNRCISLMISDESHVAETRRNAQVFAGEAGFDEVRAGKLAIVATEAATNILKHAGDGEIVFQSIRKNGNIGGVEMLALDKGPGMQDIEACLRDGFTTAGTQGSGLGAIQRQSDEFDIYSAPGKGTVVSARIWLSPVAEAAKDMVCRGISIPLKGEEICGDGWEHKNLNGIDYLLVCDGLGHGPNAAQASATARRVFLERETADLSLLLKDIHAALKSTRGAAIAIAAIDTQNNTLTYGGVGNIAGVVIDGESMKHMVSVNGTMGHTAGRFHLFNYDFPPNALIIMHSDGLQTRWSLKDYPGIARHDGSIISTALYRDFTRGRDDSTVVTIRRAA